MDDAFQDSSVERAAAGSHDQGNLSGGVWPPQHIQHYDYDAQLSPPLVDIDVDEDPVLGGDIRSSEEVGLLGGDIDMADQYKNDAQFYSDSDKKLRAMSLKIQNKISKNKKSKKSRSDPQNMAANIVLSQASGIKNSFSKNLHSSTKSQKNMHKSPNANLGCQAWCVALFYWIPIRYLCFMGSLALFILPFLDVRFGDVNFIQWLIYWYIQIFAIIGIFIESPTWILTRKIQLKIFKWCRILRRTWGRACFYISLSFLTFAELEKKTFSLSMFAGIYMVVISVIMFMFSMLAAKQYRSMYWYMRMGGNVHGEMIQLKGEEYNDEIDDDKIESRIISYFNDLDNDRDGKIGAPEIHALAEQSLNRNLSNAERYAIQTFLDYSCNGYISREDWIRQLMTYNTVKFL